MVWDMLFVEAAILTFIGDEPRGVTVGSDGDYVYVINHGGDSLAIINCDSCQTSTVEGIGHGPWGVLADPHGEHV